DGEDLPADKRKEPLRLPVGEHRLVVKRGGKVIETKTLLVKAEEPTVVSVARAPEAAPPLPPAVQALVDALGDKDGAVRRAAAEGLGKLGDEAAVPALMKRVSDDGWGSAGLLASENDPHAGGQGAAPEALRKLDKDKVPEALQAALKSDTKEVRAWATKRLAEVEAPPEKLPTAVRALVEALGDKDGAVRRAAAEGLGKL